MTTNQLTTTNSILTPRARRQVAKKSTLTYNEKYTQYIKF